MDGILTLLCLSSYQLMFGEVGLLVGWVYWWGGFSGGVSLLVGWVYWWVGSIGGAWSWNQYTLRLSELCRFVIISISTDFIQNHISLLRSMDENVSLHFVLFGYSSS